MDKLSFRSLHDEAYELSISFEIGRNYPNFSADIATDKFYRDDLASLKESLHSLGADYVYTYDDLKDKQKVQEIRSNITLKVARTYSHHNIASAVDLDICCMIGCIADVKLCQWRPHQGHDTVLGLRRHARFVRSDVQATT